MIGPVNDYRDIYVAACGEACPSWAEGKDHEQTCDRCAAETGRTDDEECDVDDRGICYEREEE